MNAHKAQEYFSLYFDGELDAGLKEQFERTLLQDAQVQAEYRAFVQTMEQLDELKLPAPEPDFDLSEAISRRMDRYYYEADRKPAKGLWTMWRKLAVGAIAVFAVVGTVASIWSANSGISQAGVGVQGPSRRNPPVKPQAEFRASDLSLQSNDGKWTLSAKVAEPQTIEIRSTEDGTNKTIQLGANDKLSSELANSDVEPRLVELKSSLAAHPVWIALPGAQASASPIGSGTLGDFAKAVCSVANVPVVVVAKSPGEAVEWNIEEPVDASKIAAVVARYGYTVEIKENGAIWIL